MAYKDASPPSGDPNRMTISGYGSDLSIFDGYTDTQYSAPQMDTEQTSTGVDVAQAIADANAAVDPVPYTPFGGGDASAPAQTTASSSSFLDAFKSASSDVIDFGNSVINLRGNLDQLKQKNTAVAAQSTQATQQANLQKAKNDATYASNMQAAQLSSSMSVLIVPAIVIGAYLLMKHK